MKMFASPKDFEKAPVGHPFLEACAACGQETGTIILKTKGRRHLPCRDSRAAASDAYIPRLIVPHEDTRCEFCEFLGLWFASEGITPKETGLQYGAAKLVKDESGSELIAFVPFSSDEEKTVALGGKTVHLAHGMVILCALVESPDGSMFQMSRVLRRGV